MGVSSECHGANAYRHRKDSSVGGGGERIPPPFRYLCLDSGAPQGAGATDRGNRGPVWNGKRTGQVRKERKDEENSMPEESGTVKVLSIQWLSRNWKNMEESPGLIVIDEAHHALAETYKELWKRYPEARKLGMTATPCRLNGKGFTDLFDTLITSWSIAEFIGKGWLSAFDYVSIRANSREQRMINSLKKRGADGDYQVKEMNEVLNRQVSIRRLYESVEKYANGKKESCMLSV